MMVEEEEHKEKCDIKEMKKSKRAEKMKLD